MKTKLLILLIFILLLFGYAFSEHINLVRISNDVRLCELKSRSVMKVYSEANAKLLEANKTLQEYEARIKQVEDYVYTNNVFMGLQYDNWGTFVAKGKTN